MVYMSHDCDDRRTRFHILFLVLEYFQSFFLLFFLDFSYYYVDSQFLCQYYYRLFIQVLVYISHDAKLHQSHDDL